MELFSLLLLLAIQEPAKEPRDTVVASATQDATPRAGIVLSNFKGSEDHDGTKVAGLVRPAPLSAKLTAAHVDAMVRKALEIGAPRAGGIETIVQPDDWVMVLCGKDAPAEVVRSVVGFLAKSGRGARFTVAGCGFKTPAELPAGKARLYLLEFEAEQFVEAPAPQGERVYAVSKTLQQCDLVVAVAALDGDLTFGAYLRAARTQPSAAAMADVFSFHPADYALLASSHLVVAGANAVALDAVGASILGREPLKMEHLDRAVKLGLGINDPDAVWTRGNEIEEARKALAARK